MWPARTPILLRHQGLNPMFRASVTRASPDQYGARRPSDWLRRSTYAIVPLLGVLTLDTSAALAAEPGLTGYVYTANERGNSISIIDLAGGRVTTVSTGISPHNIQVTADGEWLLAVGIQATMDKGHGHEEGSGRLLLFDTAAPERGPVADIPAGEHPAHVIKDRETRLAFVTDSEHDAVLVIDIVAKALVRTIKTGRYPHGLRMSPDDREIYVANVKGDSVSVIDVAHLTEAAQISVGKGPVQVGFAPDGRHAYVSLNGENGVAVVDTKARKAIAKVSVGRNPVQVFVTPDGKTVYVANQGTEAQPDNTVSVIDTATNAVIATVVVGRGAHGVAVSDDGRYAFITNIEEGTVSAIDTVTQQVVRTFNVGGGPNGVTFRAAKR